MPSRDLAPAARPRIRTVSRMTSLLSPAMPRRVLGAIMGNSINSKERGVTKSASKDDKAGGRTSMEWSFLLGSTPSAEKSSGSPVPSLVNFSVAVGHFHGSVARRPP